MFSVVLTVKSPFCWRNSIGLKISLSRDFTASVCAYPIQLKRGRTTALEGVIFAMKCGGCFSPRPIESVVAHADLDSAAQVQSNLDMSYLSLPTKQLVISSFDCTNVLQVSSESLLRHAVCSVLWSGGRRTQMVGANYKTSRLTSICTLRRVRVLTYISIYIFLCIYSVYAVYMYSRYSIFAAAVRSKA